MHEMEFSCQIRHAVTILNVILQNKEKSTVMFVLTNACRSMFKSLAVKFTHTICECRNLDLVLNKNIKK